MGATGGARPSTAVLTLQEFLSPDRLGITPVTWSICPSIDAAATDVASWHLLTIR